MISFYQERIKVVENAISGYQKRDNYFNIARLISFLIFILFIIFSINTGNTIVIVASLVSLIVFVQVILLHLKNLTALAREISRKSILENEISCLSLQTNTYYDGAVFADPEHDYTTDMDVFGKGSLFQYINRSATGVGNQALAKWLIGEYTVDKIFQRQNAVKELANRHQWCEELRVDVFNRRISDFKKEHLPEIKKTSPEPDHLVILIIVSYTILAFSVVGIIWSGNGSWLLLPVVFNLLLNLRMSRFTKSIRAQLDGREKILDDYHKILTTFEKQDFESDYLKQMKVELSIDGINASRSIAQLQNMSQRLDYSLSMITGAILNLIFIWDIILCRGISKWFDRYASKTIQWFDVVGRLEALISLANLQNNHPDWSYPVFRNGRDFQFTGKELGHPLIDQNQRVCNDFNMEGDALMAIITGSNMAGKSTFLRTIGVNIILAKLGAPVCASELTLSHFRIMTYLTITDSLTENTSTFYREIKRLKKILDSSRGDSNVLLLLDELLRGTNSADKARGSMAITRELINHKIPSIIATHNLELAEMKSKCNNQIENYYFDIIIDQDNKMWFDYKLKPGICDTFNASLLLKEIGIDI